MILLRSNLTHNRKIIRNCKKIQKIQKYSYGFISSENWLEKAEKKRKYKLAFRFVPTQRVIENSNQIVKKIQKIVKYYYGFISSQNKGGNAENGRK